MVAKYFTTFAEFARDYAEAFRWYSNQNLERKNVIKRQKL